MRKRYRTKNNITKVLEFLITEKANLARTSTTIFSDKKQNELDVKLGRIATRIKTMKNKGIQDYDIKEEFEFSVNDLISNYVEDTYLNGRNYAFKVNKIRVPLTTDDISKMDQLRIEFNERFWGMVFAAEVKEFGISLLGSFVKSLVSDLVTKSTNDAALQTMSDQSRLAQSTLSTNKIKGTFTDLETIRVEFTTRKDEKVCPICSPLDGKQYNFDDPSKPEIPQHHNCRCRLLQVKNGKAISG